MGVLLGGVIPAILFGLFAILQKAGKNAGISVGMFLLVVGSVIAVCGLIYLFGLNDPKTINGKSALYTALAGICWAVAIGLIQYTLIYFNLPISKLAPLYNTNTLIAVVLGLIVFSEWKSLNLWELGLGTVLIVMGGILVSKS